MSNDTPGKVPTVTEDTYLKTNIKTIVVLICGVFAGTMFFATVMWKLEGIAKQQEADISERAKQYAELATKIEESSKASIWRINYLFKILNLDNPFEGIYRVPTSPTASGPTLPDRGHNP